MNNVNDILFRINYIWSIDSKCKDKQEDPADSTWNMYSQHRSISFDQTACKRMQRVVGCENIWKLRQEIQSHFRWKIRIIFSINRLMKIKCVDCNINWIKKNLFHFQLILKTQIDLENIRDFQKPENIVEKLYNDRDT